MAITFDEISATVTTPSTTRAAASAPAAPATPTPDHDRRRLDDLMVDRAERLARVHAD